MQVKNLLSIHPADEVPVKHVTIRKIPRYVISFKFNLQQLWPIFFEMNNISHISTYKCGHHRFSLGSFATQRTKTYCCNFCLKFKLDIVIFFFDCSVWGSLLLFSEVFLFVNFLVKTYMSHRRVTIWIKAIHRSSHLTRAEVFFLKLILDNYNTLLSWGQNWKKG